MNDDLARRPGTSSPDSPGAGRPAGLRARLASLWALLGPYLGMRRRRPEPVNDPASLARFLDTRAAYVAQTSLYGYVRTRAGMRYPELFDDDAFVVSLDIAKWHMWLACLSDLAVYAGGLLQGHGPAARVAALMQATVADILAATGNPAEASDAFPDHARRVAARIAACDWSRVPDDETAFSESPGALVRWAPVVDELKALDEEIVRNSVRFRWQEVRRDLRQDLDAAALLAAANHPDRGGG